MCSVLPEPFRSVRVNWPVTFALEEIATAHQVPVTSLPAQVSMVKPISSQKLEESVEGVFRFSQRFSVRELYFKRNIDQ